jgi:hypothetical protein
VPIKHVKLSLVLDVSFTGKLHGSLQYAITGSAHSWICVHERAVSLQSGSRLIGVFLW